jgi:hypothetical protein
MPDTSEVAAFERLKIHASRFVHHVQVAIARIPERRLRVITTSFTIITILFPPWAGYINRNGVSAKLDGGHHFLVSGPNLLEIDYKKLTLYVLLIWLFYGVIQLVRTARK